MTGRRAWPALAAVASLAVASGAPACNAILGHQPGTLIADDAGDAGDGALEGTASDALLDARGDATSLDAAGDVPDDTTQSDGPTEAGCGDTQTSADDCGTCGHSCLGGQCLSGQCQPVVLAGDPTKYDGLFSLYGLTILGSTLYGTDWNAQNLVYRVPIPDAGAAWDASPDFIVPLGTRDTRGLDITTDGTKLFYGIFEGSGAGIWSVNADGTNDSPVQSLIDAQVIAADATYVYWTVWGAGGGYGPGVYQANKDGTGSVTYSLQSTMISWVLPDNGQVLLTEAFNKYVAVAAPTDLNTTQPLCAPVASASQLGQQTQVEGAYVYFTDIAGRFYRAPRTPQTQPPPAQEITPTGAVPSIPFVVDASHVYALGGGKIVRFNNDGSGGAVVLATLSDTAVTVVQDATSIYFTTYGNFANQGPPYSALWRLAK
jgi:hypothetical protein